MSINKIPSHVSQTLTICRYELLRYSRGKKTIGIILITLAFSILLVAIPDISGTPRPLTAAEAFSTPLDFVFFAIVLVAAFLGSNSIISEFHDKTGFLLFTNPISKTSIWFGKFVAAEIIAVIMIFLYFGTTFVYASINYDHIPEQVLLSLAFSLLSVTMIMSLTFFVSSASKGPTGAAVLIFFLFIIILPVFDQLLINFSDIKPWFTPTFSSEIIVYAIIDPYPSDITDDIARGPFDIDKYVPYIFESVLVMSAYLIVSAFLSIMIFRRRELS